MNHLQDIESVLTPNTDTSTASDQLHKYAESILSKLTPFQREFVETEAEKVQELREDVA